MNGLSIPRITSFVNNNIDDYHAKRAAKFDDLTLKRMLKRKNPYMFRAHNIQSVSEFADALLAAHISSSDESIFGQFLEDLAVFICGETFGGRKSAATGVDLEFERDGTYYLVAIKSGPNWANSSQWAQLRRNLDSAVTVIRQNRHTSPPLGVCGMCYGDRRSSSFGTHRKVYGQNFWSLISGLDDLYLTIIQPLEYRAKEHNDVYLAALNRVRNQFMADISTEFLIDGQLDWPGIVSFCSKAPNPGDF